MDRIANSIRMTFSHTTPTSMQFQPLTQTGARTRRSRVDTRARQGERDRAMRGRIDAAQTSTASNNLSNNLA
jgi:hypothetical protein